MLEADANKRGDLFARLMEDLFASLGYQRFRFNIHKSGRELDLEGEHRTENRVLIAECKATDSPIGGAELNKFYGALDVERRKKGNSNSCGYFVSLAGFTETAIEQEKEAGLTRFVPLSGEAVVQELITGRIIVPERKAMELAGRCINGDQGTLVSELRSELLAHQMGWIWAVYFGRGKQRTHFALVHADGTFIAHQIAQQIIDADASVDGGLTRLQYLSPPADRSVTAESLAEAWKQYAGYLGRECGEIQLEGLPADQEVGSRKIDLESIFVPLHLIEQQPSSADATQSSTGRKSAGPKKSRDARNERLSIGEVLSKHARVAVLGLPGGGKSTLLKRLAIAYAFPERRKLIHDDLPDRVYLPLFLRCRQLQSMVRAPIIEILRGIAKRAEIEVHLATAFSSLVSRSLQNGEALVLVDGLDEISEEGDRVAFVQQLRTFIATYPAATLVVTSRSAGFRIIGGALSGHCRHYDLADFNDDDIVRLTVAWHKEIVGSTKEIISEAEKLAHTISATDRVRRLAQNPLLLTTLLLVKRWVGQLPTKRSVLYGKAVDVLLTTWNVEGHLPIDSEEALPQLEFLAFTMMKMGTQRLSLRKLKQTLAVAKSEMPEILGYTTISAQEFLERVESRSSLLMMSGHEVEQGTLYPVYEFRHLTFQEYLAARAIVDGCYPGRKDSDTLFSLLRPHLADQNWEEVILLSAVLAGRKVLPLVRELINVTDASVPWDSIESGFPPARLLAECILDEIQIPPDVMKDGLRCVGRRIEDDGLIAELLKGKHGKMFADVCTNTFQESTSDLLQLGSVVAEHVIQFVNWSWENPNASDFDQLLSAENPLNQAQGWLGVMYAAWRSRRRGEEKLSHSLREPLIRWASAAERAFGTGPIYLQVSVGWATAWLLQAVQWTAESCPIKPITLLRTLMGTQNEDLRLVTSWAFVYLPVHDRSLGGELCAVPGALDFVEQLRPRLESDPIPFRQKKTEYSAALVLGYYLQSPWNDEELAAQISDTFDGFFQDEIKIKLLRAIGEPGLKYLNPVKGKKKAARRS